MNWCNADKALMFLLFFTDDLIGQEIERGIHVEEDDVEELEQERNVTLDSSADSYDENDDYHTVLFHFYQFLSF